MIPHAHRSIVAPALLVGFAVAIPIACKQKEPPPPPQNTYQVGSVVINLPPSVSVPYPQGRPDEPTVNAVKCTYVVDKKISLIVKANPTYKDQMAQMKPALMQECQTKWTQQQYDCMVASKDLQSMLYCTRFQRP